MEWPPPATDAEECSEAREQPAAAVRVLATPPAVGGLIVGGVRTRTILFGRVARRRGRVVLSFVAQQWGGRVAGGGLRLSRVASQLLGAREQRRRAGVVERVSRVLLVDADRVVDPNRPELPRGQSRLRRTAFAARQRAHSTRPRPRRRSVSSRQRHATDWSISLRIAIVSVIAGDRLRNRRRGGGYLVRRRLSHSRRRRLAVVVGADRSPLRRIVQRPEEGAPVFDERVEAALTLRRRVRSARGEAAAARALRRRRRVVCRTRPIDCVHVQPVLREHRVVGDAQQRPKRVV